MLSSLSISINILINCVFSYVELPSSCLNQEDGYRWLKLMDGDDYPPIYQKCENEYMVIDINNDENVQKYFSSYDTWHYALAGPSQMDGPNWEQWWLPNNEYLTKSTNDDNYFQYIISPDCSTCDLTNNAEFIEKYSFNGYTDDPNGDRTSYYMTGTIFGCLYTHKALRDCVWDWDTYQCGYCTIDKSDADLGYHTMFMNDNQHDDNNREISYYKSIYKDNPQWPTLQVSLCGVYPLSTYSESLIIPQTRDECNTFQQNTKPSIGTDGRFCVCTKPPVNEYTDLNYKLSPKSFDTYKHEYILQKSETTETSSVDDVYELYQSDFLEGTYRITKSGTYKIMSDIEFDFNAGNLNDPNTGSSWWPRVDQVNDYPGAYSTRDEYFMGFFAGITIETDDVIIDLNGFELRMSRPFYYQQRFFSCIALKSVVFSLNQGPGIFGTDPQFASNIVIKDGSIGLSSHFGIHGQGNNNVRIENVHVHSFETHGIEMSAFEDLTITDVEIGPSSHIAYLKGEYAYARFSLQRLERILESQDNDDNEYYNDIFPLQFDGRDEELDFKDIIFNLKNLMDIAFKSIMKIETYDEDDEDYITAKKLFINSDGIPYGAVMYGLFLNLYFANVFAIHPSLKHSHNANIQNLVIHDLYHKMDEYIRLDKYMTAPYKNPYNAAIDAKSMLGEQIKTGYNNIDWTQVKYVGDALTDAHITLDLVTEDWGEKGLLLIGDELAQWALGNHVWTSDDSGHPYIGCNADRMTHVAKGVIGIRMDGVEDINFRSLNIYNLNEYSKLGSDLCSNYWDEDFKHFNGKGHFLQNTPYMYGYTGNMAHGIFSDWSTYNFENDINIHDIYSKTGLVRGIGAYTSNNINFVSSIIKIYNLGAGTNLYETNTDDIHHPYAPTIAKPFHIITDYKYDDSHTFDTTIISDDSSIIGFECIFGRDGVGNDYEHNTKYVDNRNCNSKLFEIKPDDFNIDGIYAIKESPSTSTEYSSSVIWSVVMLSSIAVIIIFVYLSKSIYICIRKKNKTNVPNNEFTALAQNHFSHYYGSYS